MNNKLRFDTVLSFVLGIIIMSIFTIYTSEDKAASVPMLIPTHTPIYGSKVFSASELIVGSKICVEGYEGSYHNPPVSALTIASNPFVIAHGDNKGGAMEVVELVNHYGEYDTWTLAEMGIIPYPNGARSSARSYHGICYVDQP